MRLPPIARPAFVMHSCAMELLKSHFRRNDYEND